MSGHEWVLEGEVVRGKRLGRTLGFPTANLDARVAAGCPRGVYYAVTEVDGIPYRAIVNIGRHPTVPDGPPTVEAHLLLYSGDLYGKRLTLRLLRYLRGEMKFDSLEALREQLERDSAEALRQPL